MTCKIFFFSFTHYIFILLLIKINVKIEVFQINKRKGTRKYIKRPISRELINWKQSLQ